MAKWVLCLLCAFACAAHAEPGLSRAPGDALTAPGPGTLSVSSMVIGCTFTVNVTWSGFAGGNDTLEVSLLQVFPATGDGVILEPSVFVHPVKGKGGSVTVTLPARAESATTNSFRAAASLLDNKGALMSPSSSFSDVIVAYCSGL